MNKGIDIGLFILGVACGVLILMISLLFEYSSNRLEPVSPEYYHLLQEVHPQEENVKLRFEGYYDFYMEDGYISNMDFDALTRDLKEIKEDE